MKSLRESFKKANRAFLRTDLMNSYLNYCFRCPLRRRPGLDAHQGESAPTPSPGRTGRLRRQPAKEPQGKIKIDMVSKVGDIGWHSLLPQGNRRRKMGNEKNSRRNRIVTRFDKERVVDLGQIDSGI